MQKGTTGYAFTILVVAGLALLAVFPAGRLPNYRPGEIPDPDDEAGSERERSA